MRLSQSKWSAGLLAGLALCVCVGAWAQDDPPKVQMIAKNADPDWEVVTVRPSDPNGEQYGFQLHGREVDLYRRTVEQLLVFGYGMHEKQLVNVPEWARHEEWDVKGVPDIQGRLSVKQYKGLVRKVLMERFGLSAHVEQREMAVFALAVGRGGPKMAKSGSDPSEPADENEDSNGGQTSMRAVNMSMGELAQWMNFAADKPVVDKTGLTERYDFSLKWTDDEIRTPAGSSAPPGLGTAVEEQLGLKLEPVKAAADVLVVDKVERPGAN